MCHRISLPTRMGAMILLALVSSRASAQTATFTNLVTLTVGNTGWCADPVGDLTVSGSTLYGMTESGGTGAIGNVFSVNTDGSGLTNLFSFDMTNPTDGCEPWGSLTLSGTTLFGMTEEGGANNYGNIFKIGTSGTGIQNLLSFSGTSGTALGELPEYNNLTLGGTTLYGMTPLGGASGAGTIFSIGTNGNGFKTLLSFSGTNGDAPYGSLTLSGTTLYGMTAFGGAYGYGNIFEINTDGSGFKTLLSFSGSTGTTLGAYPSGSLTLSGSTLYGMTQTGGTNGGYGNIFSVGTNGDGFKNLLSFSGTTGTALGAYPYGSLTLSGTTLYGMTTFGGANGYGNVFSIGITGTGFQNLVLV